MTTKVISIRHNEEELEQAREWCKDNVTTLPLQLRELIKRLSKKQTILKGEDKDGVN